MLASIINKGIRVFVLAIFFLPFPASAQDNNHKVIDQVVAIVGKNIILESDIENQYQQFRLQGEISGDARTAKCQILETLLFQKLMLNQAELDSIEITDAMIDQEMNFRLRYFISQLGSKEAFEEYYGKSIPEFKEEFRSDIKEQLLIQEVEKTITQNVNVTPADVKKFYNSIPADSIPLVNSEVVIGQIVKKPPVSLEQKLMVKEKLRELRQRIMQGEDFSTLAVLYSEDPGSANKGGELGLFGRGELYPEFEAVAFKLQQGEISEIVETEAGFHIIQLIERKGEYVNTRHILMRTKVAPMDLLKAKQKLDTIAGEIRSGDITFDEAVIKYSDDPSKNNGGLLINPAEGTTRFEVNQLDPSVSFVIDKLKVGEVSNPVVMQTEEGKDAYRILYLKQRTLPHRANLKEDYTRIQKWALQNKKEQIYKEWISKKVNKTYIKIIDRYQSCDFENKWLAEN